VTKYSLAQLTVLQASPPELIRIAAAAGYDYVGLRLLEVTGGDAWPLASEPQLLRETKAAMAAHGVGVLDIELVRLQPNTSIYDLRPTLDAAAELGARHVLTQAHDPDWARLVDNFGSLCDLLEIYGMTADVEFLTWTSMRGLAEVQRLLKAANRSSVGITIDTLHFFRSACKLQDLTDASPDLFHFIQISDAPAVGPTTTEGLIFAAREERLEPGTGELDLAGILRALPADITIAVEIPNSQLAARITDEERASRSLQSTKALVQQVHSPGGRH
jgi:sugar phosphate isomerase/epimerase